jgi:hypothetical protein
MLVPVAALGPADGGEAIDVLDFASLARLARYTERPVLVETTAEQRIYGIQEDGHLYVYRAAAHPIGGLAVVPAGPPVTRATATRGTARRPRWLKPGIAALVVVVAISIATSFTATTTVPISHAGVSTEPISLSQLAPTQCAGLALTHLVIATGSTVTGTSGNDLILGKSGAGTFTLTGSGGVDCIVAGGGPGTTNKISGGKGGGVCIGAPGAINQFSNCSQTY